MSSPDSNGELWSARFGASVTRYLRSGATSPEAGAAAFTKIIDPTCSCGAAPTGTASRACSGPRGT